MRPMRCLPPVLPLILMGCATAPEPVAISTIFNPSEVAWFSQTGGNSIRGNAVMRTVGGEVRTCAGLPANLVPVSAYAEDRFRLMYGSRSESGFLPAMSGLRFSSTDPQYEAASKQTRCDAQGNFTFSNLPDGEYFVTALVTWSAPGLYGSTSTQGGYLMKRVRLSGGEAKEIVLTPD